MDEEIQIQEEENQKREEKKNRKKNRRNIITAVVVSAVVSSYLTNIVRDNIYIPTTSRVSDFTNKMQHIDNVIEKHYLYDVDANAMKENAVASYVEGLDEPYTHYYNAEEFESYMTGLQESYVGIGVVIYKNDNNEIEILSPFEDSPAHKAGILPGDIIKTIDSTAYSGDDMNDAVNYIKGGPAGTSVTLGIVRDGGEAFDVTIERSDVSADSVKTEMLKDNVGYVRITAFNTADESGKQDTYTEFREKVNQLLNDGMKGMVIDLRDNPGGALDIVCNICDMLVGEGLITYMEYKSGKREEFKSDANELNVPISIIINENSASASEVLTGCLKDYGKAVVVGKKSYGKGIVQTVYPFFDGSGMTLTVAKYFSPKGTCIQGTGIEPDIEVEVSEKYKNMYASSIPKEDDSQLIKAVEAVKEKMAE